MSRIVPGDRRHAIPTAYRGIEFRSRLEAQWAVFFDQFKIEWEYEPFDLAGYIPDFVLPGDSPVLVDVKPISTAQGYWERAEELEDLLGGWSYDGWNDDVLILGIRPSILPESNIGALGESNFGMDQLSEEVNQDEDPAWCFGAGVFGLCFECLSHGFSHESCSFTYRPCGHYPGGAQHHADQDEIDQAWAHAKQVTRWLPRRT